MDPAGVDIHHFILQYLEEGTMDLVCLSTDLVMEHCDAIREAAGAIIDQTLGTDRCNCWFDAYAAIYGVCPVVDMDFITCPGTVAPTVCTGEDEVVEETVPDETVPDETDETVPDMPSPPEKPSGKPTGRR